MHFIREHLEPALIIAGRNEDPDAKYPITIRATLGSYTNHNALIVRDSRLGFAVGDTVKPRSAIVPLSHYEQLMNEEGYIIRVWRVKGLTEVQRNAVSTAWRTRCVGLPYADHSIAKLGVFRFVNNVPWRLHIRGAFCSDNTAKAFTLVLPLHLDPMRKPDGRKKHNPTPRTYENRLVQGILEDVTERMIQND